MKTRTALPWLPSLPIALIAFFALSVCSFSVLHGHELEDGCIEKAMSVVIRDGVATIELAVGINPVTMQQQLSAWEEKKTLAVQRAESAEPKKSDADLQPVEPPQVGEDADSSEAPAVSPVAPADKRSQEDDINDRFRQFAFEQFAKEIKVEIDGQKIPVTKVSVEQSPRHHFDLIAKYSFSMPKGQGQPQSKLLINDLTLLKMSGGSRYSLKAAGKSILFNSNVSPIVVRAERNDLGKLSEKGLAKARRIEAVVGGALGTEIEKK